MSRPQRGFWLAFAALALAKAVLAARLPLFGDEAWYWLEGQRPAWAYSDLPGLTAWLIRFGTDIAGDSALGVRWPFLAMSLALPLLVRATAAQWFGEGRGKARGVAGLAVPAARRAGLAGLAGRADDIGRGDLPAGRRAARASRSDPVRVHAPARRRCRAVGAWVDAGRTEPLPLRTHRRRGFRRPAARSAWPASIAQSVAVVRHRAGRARMAAVGRMESRASRRRSRIPAGGAPSVGTALRRAVVRAGATGDRQSAARARRRARTAARMAALACSCGRAVGIAARHGRRAVARVRRARLRGRPRAREFPLDAAGLAAAAVRDARRAGLVAARVAQRGPCARARVPCRPARVRGRGGRARAARATRRQPLVSGQFRRLARDRAGRARAR